MSEEAGFVSFGQPGPGTERASLKARLEEYERSLIKGALSATGGNQRQAARRLGILPTTLHAKIRRLGIERPLRPGVPARARDSEGARTGE
jgi:DNA-binding NtrC family response regulator